MWQRSELKARAKIVMKSCYWKAILVSLILCMISGGGSSGSSATAKQVRDTTAENGGIEYLIGFLIAFSVILMIAVIIGIAVGIFIFYPLEIGAKRFFIISRVQQADLNEIGFGFKHCYLNIVKTQFLRGIFTFLWSLLFIIPGIIKSYEYRMIPYILAENPGIDSKDIFAMSRDMMEGEKWNAFVLDLSFIGWNILSIFTCGILSVFYVNPYIYITDTELYAVLRTKITGNVNSRSDWENTGNISQ